MCIDNSLSDTKSYICLFFFFNHTAPSYLYTLSLHDALPISSSRIRRPPTPSTSWSFFSACGGRAITWTLTPRDRKSTRLNSSHANISYAVFCLKKKKKQKNNKEYQQCKNRNLHKEYR